MWFAKLIAALVFPVLAHASDGVVEISQALAIAGGVTAGDEPGFPVRLKHSGSYVLTSDLVNADPVLHVIVVEADDVNINLNGFSLIGSNSCSGIGANRTCTYTGNSGEPMGDGITSSFQKGVTIHSGTIRNMARHGIAIGNVPAVDGDRVSDVTAKENGGSGIVVSAGSLLRNVSAVRNGEGISTGHHSTVLAAIARDNVGTGIRAGGFTQVRDSSSHGNGSNGISLKEGCLIIDTRSSFNGLGINDNSGIGGSSAIRVKANRNQAFGIYMRDNSLVVDSVSTGNGQGSPSNDGIVVGANSQLRGNLASGNFGHGLDIGPNGNVESNTSSDNQGLGIQAGPGTRVHGNSVGGNTSGTIQGGVVLDDNVCNGNTTCP